MRTARLPAAAADAVADVVSGPARAGTVVGSTEHALLVSAGPELLCVAGPDAVRLPCALVLAAPPPRFEAGTPVTVRDGAVALPDATSVQVARWWRVPRPVLGDPRGAAQRAAALLPVRRQSLPGYPQPRLWITGQRLASHRSWFEEFVRRLLGLGPGLTPAGDDVLAGALVTLTAARHPAAAGLRDALAAADPHRRTTAVSAALLSHAARGECVPQLADLLAALDTDGDVAAARARLLAVGHTSGAALLLGVRRACDVIAASTPGRDHR